MCLYTFMAVCLSCGLPKWYISLYNAAYIHYYDDYLLFVFYLTRKRTAAAAFSYFSFQENRIIPF